MPHIASYGNIWEWDVVVIRHPVADFFWVYGNGLGVVKMFSQSLTVGDDPY